MADATNLEQKLSYLNETKSLLKNAIIAKGQQIDDTTPFRDYVDKVSQIESGSGDVKLFETQEEMQADTTAKEGDLAVVYRSSIANAQADSQFQIATFPETVVLDTAIADYVDVRYRAVDDSVMFDWWGRLDANMFRMDCYSESSQIRIEYTSTDGITYTRSRLEGKGVDGDSVDFGTSIYYERAERWNDAIGKFIQIGSYNFEGLYEYKNHDDRNYMYMYKGISYYYDNSNALQVNYKEQSVFPIGQYYDTINTIRKAIGLNGYIDATCVYDGNDTLTLYYQKYNDTSTYSDKLWYCKDNTDTIYMGISTSSKYAKKLVITLSTGKYTETNLDLVSTIVESSLYVYDTINSSNYIFALCIGSGGIDWSYDIIFAGYNYNNTKLAGVYLHTLSENKIEYCIAPTQLTLKAANELLPGKIAYGKDGVVKGDESIYDNLSQEDVLTKIYGLTKSETDYYTGINKQTDLLLTRNIVDKCKYNMVRLKKLDNFDPSTIGMVIPIDNIRISKHNLYQFSDIIPEMDFGFLVSSGGMVLSDDGKTLGLINLYNYNSYIIDLKTHSVVKTFITRNVKLYKHKVFYATNDLADTSSSDLNYYCYDLNTRENTVVATRPIGSVTNKYICRVNTNGRIITILTYDRNSSSYENAVNATFIDCESNQTSNMSEIAWTTSGNYVGNVISCATNDGIYILVLKFRGSSSSSLICASKCDLNLVTSNLLTDVIVSGTSPVIGNSYAVVGVQYGNILIYKGGTNTNTYYINLTNATGSNLPKNLLIDLSSNNIAMGYKEGNYYPIIGIDNTSHNLILDESKFIPDGYERTRIQGTEVFIGSSIYQMILTLETDNITVTSWGNIVANAFNVTLLTTVHDTTYDYIAINIGGMNGNTGPRFIPLGTTGSSGPISLQEYNQALDTAKDILMGGVIPLPNDLEYADDKFRSISEVQRMIQEMDSIEAGEYGALYLKEIKSMLDINPNMKLSCGLNGVNLLDYGAVWYDRPKHASGHGNDLGGNFFITDGPLPKGFSYDLEGYGGMGGSKDWNENHDEEPYAKYGDKYLYCRFYGSYMNEIDYFTEYSEKLTGGSVCKLKEVTHNG